MESAALAEKLLNDMLKATEAFNKLKKINEELKSQVGGNTEPLKQENQRIMSENSQLHLEVI
jgi:regulator of replication initiation timing